MKQLQLFSKSIRKLNEREMILKESSNKLNFQEGQKGILARQNKLKLRKWLSFEGFFVCFTH